MESNSREGTLVFMAEFTRILSRIGQRDPRAAEQLLPLLYDELCNLATARMAQPPT